jgi:hypothetical protein
LQDVVAPFRRNGERGRQSQHGNAKAKLLHVSPVKL